MRRAEGTDILPRPPRVTEMRRPWQRIDSRATARQLRCRRWRHAPRRKSGARSPVLNRLTLTEKEGNKPDISAEERGSPSSPPSPPPPFIPFIQPRRRKLMIGRKPTAGHIRENRALESCLLTQLAEPNVTLELGYISSWD